MTKQYRIKRNYYGYFVQRKILFFWKTLNQFVHYYNGSTCAPAQFETYADAKEYLEKDIMLRNAVKRLETERKSFKTKYIYPPFPDKEPK